jgi:hypothetical protein
MRTMSRWRALTVVVLAASVSVAGVTLLLAVNAEVSGEAVAAGPPGAAGPGGAVRSERISPPGAPVAPAPGRPLPRPLPGVTPHARGPDAIAPPTFRLGGFPGVAGPEMTAVEPPGQGHPEDEDELQRQLAGRRLAALERRVRAMNRRIRNMGDRGSTPEQVQSQKDRMEALLEEIRQKREEQGMPAFQLEEEDPQ